MEKPTVYFTRDLTPAGALKVLDRLGKTLPGRVAVKLHSGEVGNQNFLRPDFSKPIVDWAGGTVVECNTAYPGGRDTTEKHWRTIELHGWNRYFTVDLMDAAGPDLVLDIPDGVRLKKDYVGRNVANYDSVLVLSHFKGHPNAGYGGALKQLSIGFASSYGKDFIHSAGDMTIEGEPEQDAFLESMADAASAVAKYFGENVVYLNVMKNLSVDCDCCEVAEDPCMADIGILASLDPVAIDQACLDLVRASGDPGRDHFLQRVDSLHGEHVVEAAAALGVGSRAYTLEEI